MGRGCCTLQKLRWTGSRNLFTMQWSWNTRFHTCAYQSVHTNLLQMNVFTQKCLLIIFTKSFPLKANNITEINDTLGSALELFGKVQWHHVLFLTCDFAHSQIRLNWATAIVNVSKSLSQLLCYSNWYHHNRKSPKSLEIINKGPKTWSASFSEL